MRTLLTVLIVLVVFLGLQHHAEADPASRSPQQNATEAFYVALDSHAYQQAYAFFSPRYQASHPYNDWVAGYANTIAFDWRTYPTGGATTVGVGIISIDSTAAGRSTQYFSGVWHLVRSSAPGGWALDSAEIGAGAPWGTTADMSAFADDWGKHGYELYVRPDGTATARYRTYSSCSDDPTPPCDLIIGNQIADGGHATITFMRVAGSSAYGAYDDGGSVTLTLLPYGMAVLVDSTGESITLCGSAFADLAPQDLIAQSPCGA